MLSRHEHRQVLSKERRAAGKSAAANRDALGVERARWKRDRSELKTAQKGHRRVLEREQSQVRAALNAHKVALAENPWLRPK